MDWRFVCAVIRVSQWALTGCIVQTRTCAHTPLLTLTLYLEHAIGWIPNTSCVSQHIVPLGMSLPKPPIFIIPTQTNPKPIPPSHTFLVFSQISIFPFSPLFAYIILYPNSFQSLAVCNVSIRFLMPHVKEYYEQNRGETRITADEYAMLPHLFAYCKDKVCNARLFLESTPLHSQSPSSCFTLTFNFSSDYPLLLMLLIFPTLPIFSFPGFILTVWRCLLLFSILVYTQPQNMVGGSYLSQYRQQLDHRFSLLLSPSPSAFRRCFLHSAAIYLHCLSSTPYHSISIQQRVLGQS